MPAPRRSIARVLPPRPVPAAIVMLSFTALLYVVQTVNWFTDGELNGGGVIARRLDGLDGVLWMPFLHASWAHLAANTVPFLVFGFLAMAGGIVQWVMVTAVIWLVSGFGVWLTGPDMGATVGASGLIFGWLVFLLARGFFARSLRQIALALVLFLIWGGALFGVLPQGGNISWQAHLFGALAGLLCASLVARADRAQALPT